MTTSENDQTINAVMQEMDGFSKTTGVFLIAATNTADQLDDAIIRAGHFDRQITVLPPRDWKVRLKLFEHYVSATKKAADLTDIARQCVGFTGADIDAVVNEARLIAAMSGLDMLTRDCFEHAIDKRVFKASRSSSKERHEKDIGRGAYHEAGHAVMTYLCGETIARASIIGSTGDIGGAVFQADKDSAGLTTKSKLERQIKICYAGQSAEKLILRDISDGAGSDITKATRLLNLYVSKYGMDDTFGAVDLEVLCLNAIESPALSRVQTLAATFSRETLELLREHVNLLHAVADAIIQQETLLCDEVLKAIESADLRLLCSIWRKKSHRLTNISFFWYDIIRI